jgi:DNA modification methylase
MRDNLDELRHIEGFPIGEDEDLHVLSDPPHYTAYPNPHVAEFIEKWGTPYDEATDDYHREPYVADVSEGKGGAIYSAHSYHTKVPYKAIVPFIKHYTEPGDIVFDGFCGTGMTGIASQMTNRRTVLCDLSPAATFIAYNYNTPVDSTAFKYEAKRILEEVEIECGWMYETRHSDQRKGTINYTVWSDVFICPYCNEEVIFWDAAVEQGKVRGEFPCPACSAQVTKRDLSRATLRTYDGALDSEINRACRVPVLINYSVDHKRYEKRPDTDDLALIDRIENEEIPYWYPTTRIDRDIDIWYERDYHSLGIYAVHHFYTKRNLWMTAYLWDQVRRVKNARLRHHLMFWLQSVTMGFSLLNRYRAQGYSQVNQLLSGTLYVGATTAEIAPWYALTGKITAMSKAPSLAKEEHVSITTCSTTGISLPADSFDYVFTDPPFGSNIIYSDLSIVWESWLRAFTNTGEEAVVHRRKHKGNSLDDYRALMTEAFAQMHKALKPGRWITVVFHNSRASVWNAIQEALAHAGFLVAQVTVLDKQQDTFKQVTAPGAVKNDLVISAYKPRAEFAQRFLTQAGQELEAEFVRQHLQQLPLNANVERTKEMLYSKYLAYYVQHGYQVAYNAEQFYRALPQWGLVELDGYWFAGEAQGNEYETRKAKRSRPRGKVARKQSVLFISDERSARQWLWSLLETPMTYDEIYTAFVKALQTPEDQIPELKQMLEEGFVRTNGQWKRPDALAREEMEAKRQARLLRQFEEYLEAARAGRRLTEVRKEALVAGFTEAYRAGRFQDILAVGRRLPKRLIESSPDIFDFIDIAEAKVEA